MRAPRRGASDAWTEHEVGAAEGGGTVREVLRGPMRISGRMIQRLTRSAGVLVNGRPTYLDRRVRAGDRVAVRVAAAEEPVLPPVAMPLRIAYEDAYVLVVDKPAGLLVHPTGPEHRRTLAHGVAHHLAEQGVRALVRPVHRIDRDVSGLVLFAKSAHVQGLLDAQLRDHTLRRTYLALVQGLPASDAGRVDAPIGRRPGQPTLRAVAAGGEPARTAFRVVERLADAALVELELETGRTHQIRVHMAHLGHPLLGDRWYGGPARAGLGRPALHAHRLAFRHPSSAEVTEVVAPLPEEMADALVRLRGLAAGA